MKLVVLTNFQWLSDFRNFAAGHVRHMIWFTVSICIHLSLTRWYARWLYHPPHMNLAVFDQDQLEEDGHVYVFTCSVLCR